MQHLVGVCGGHNLDLGNLGHALESNENCISAGADYFTPAGQPHALMRAPKFLHFRVRERQTYVWLQRNRAAAFTPDVHARRIPI